jgi:hypothetical protein
LIEIDKGQRERVKDKSRIVSLFWNLDPFARTLSVYVFSQKEQRAAGERREFVTT